MTHGPDGACPCGSGKTLAQCCGVYLEGKSSPPTAETLMRSRYTAYVLRDAGYLRSTWHSRSCPEDLELDDANWEGLTVRRCQAGGISDTEGRVEFIARYRQNRAVGQLHEVSHFVRENGHWVYLDGSFRAGAAALSKPGRNDPCPCGSGKKFKKCCGE